MKTQFTYRVIADYILSCIDGEGYNVELTDEKSKIEFLYNTFCSEKWKFQEDKAYYNGNQKRAFKDWLQGLPSSFNVAFENWEILELGKEWGLLRKNASEISEDAFLEYWFQMITDQCYILFGKYYTNKILVGMTTNHKGHNQFIQG